jgi:hypothetical protein
MLESGGPEVLSSMEVMHIFEEVSERGLEVQFVLEEALQAQQEGAKGPR